VFDVRQLNNESIITNEKTLNVHNRLVRRCSFHPLYANLVASVAEDCQVKAFKIENESFEQM
jgi:hypothetical protein